MFREIFSLIKLSDIRILFSLLILFIFKRSSAYSALLVVLKENQILKRKLGNVRTTSVMTNRERGFIHRLVTYNKKIGKYLTIVTPETVLKKWCEIQVKRQTYPHQHVPGRPPYSHEIRDLVISMKKKNYLWGYRRISYEMKKLDFSVSKDTVCRIIQKGRKDGTILPNGSWKRFLKSHWDSLFCCDFMTVETVFQKRFYIFFLMRLRDRKIVQYGITQNPDMGFLRNQLAGFMFNREAKKTYLIHDNSGELKWMDYSSLGIKGVAITPYSPNMNSYAERFVRSVRSECLDHFVVMNHGHLRNLVKSYMKYYNTMRPHQGIDGKVPDGHKPESDGEIGKVPVLFGLHHHYYRKAS